MLFARSCQTLHVLKQQAMTPLPQSNSDAPSRRLFMYLLPSGECWWAQIGQLQDQFT